MAGSVNGREKELAAIDDLLAPSTRAEIRALAIEGEPGIGKTPLWREGVVRAEAGGYGVLSCRAAQAETRLSFAGLADLLASSTQPLASPTALSTGAAPTTGRGRSPWASAAAHWYRRPSATSNWPKRPPSGRSPSTDAFQCPSSSAGPLWSSVSSSAGAGNGGRHASRSRGRSRCSRGSA